MDKKYTIDELQHITGFSRRTIRFYIVEGLVYPPAGSGRGSYYLDSHLNKLLQIKSLQERGMRLDEIREYLSKVRPEKPADVGQVWVRYEIAPGLEVNVRRDVDEAKRDRIDEIVRLAGQLMKEGKENEE